MTLRDVKLTSRNSHSLNTHFIYVKQHFLAFRFVCTHILPAIYRTGRKPLLFSKCSGMGDIICTFPASLELKRRFPRTEVIYHCHSQFSCLPRLAGLTENVTSIAQIGLVGYWYHFLLAGFYQFISDDDRPDVIPNDVYIRDFGREFGVELTGDHPTITPSSASIANVKANLKNLGFAEGPLIVIHSGPSWPVREWPHAAWVALIQGFSRHGFKNIVQIGSSSHLRLGLVGSYSLPGVFSLVDQLSLEESISLISLADLFVGIDSGLLHAAAGVRTPSVGIWGPTSAQLRFSTKYTSLFVTSTAACQGCHHRVPRLHWITNCPHGIKCMRDISAEDVLQMCLKQIGHRK